MHPCNCVLRKTQSRAYNKDLPVAVFWPNVALKHALWNTRPLTSFESPPDTDLSQMTQTLDIACFGTLSRQKHGAQSADAPKLRRPKRLDSRSQSVV